MAKEARAGAGPNAKGGPAAIPVTLTINGERRSLTVEPWVTRLEREANGKVLVEQSDAVATVLASSVKFLRDRRNLITSMTRPFLLMRRPAAARRGTRPRRASFRRACRSPSR